MILQTNPKITTLWNQCSQSFINKPRIIADGCKLNYNFTPIKVYENDYDLSRIVVINQRLYALMAYIKRVRSCRDPLMINEIGDVWTFYGHKGVSSE